MKFLSLFSGIGGLDLGFECAGMQGVGQVEIDDAAQSVLRRHWPKVPRFDDIRGVGADELAAIGQIDLIVGGFPCQDVSVAGRRAGLAGERSGLWYEFHRVIALARPRWLVIENVPGLLSSCGCPDCRPPTEAGEVGGGWRPDHRGRDFALLLSGLVELGYGVAWRVLDAQYFGVAQRRRRVFLVGHLGEPWSASASVLFEPQSCAGDSPPSRTPREDVAGTLGGGSGSRGWTPDTDRMTFVPEIARALLSPDSGYRCGGESETFIGGDAVHAVADTLRSHPRPGSATTGAIVPLANAAVRRLTPTECERLQGFPDGWTASGADGPQSDSARYRQLGNAVAVPCAAWIGSRIRAL